MILLWTAVGVLGAGTVVNLLLTLALVRRLRTGAAHAPDGLELPAGGLPETGLLVGEFVERSTTGRTLSTQTLGEQAIVAFVSPHCPSCRTAAAVLIARSAELPASTITFIIGDPDGVEDQAFAAELATIADVAFVEPFGATSDAFGGVVDLPVVVRVQDGQIAAASTEVRDVLLPAPAPALGA